MKLTTNRKETGVDYDSYYDLLPHEYIFFGKLDGGERIGMVFKCPGCQEPLGIQSHSEPKWTIDFEKLTAKPSILHDKTKGGCGWHGYLTDGELITC